MFNKIISNLIWNLCLSFGNILPLWFMRKGKHHCSVACQIFQRINGGKLVYLVKVDWPEHKICGHFMNYIDGHIVDLNGNKWNGSFIIGAKGDFGNGDYIITQFADRFSEFGINSVPKLLEETKRLHKEFCKK